MALRTYQTLDADLTAIAGLTPANDDFIQRKSGVWVNRTVAQVVADLAIPAGAPTGADYLVGTANGGLSAEIVVGTSPGGELGGTWASPTIDATHSGTSHAGAASAAVTTHEGLADPHTGYRLESADHTHASSGLQAGQVAHSALSGITATDHHVAPAAGPDANVTVDAAGAAGTASTFARSGHGHQVGTDSGVASTQAFGDAATAGTSGTIQRQGHKHAMPADPVTAHVAAGDPHTGYVLESLLDTKGDLIAASADNTPAKLMVGADDTILMADAAAASGLKWVASASPSAVGTAAATGTADTFTRGDHVHAHETAHTGHDTIWDAKGDLVAGTGADAAAKVTVGADDTILMADAAQSTGLKWVASATPSTQAFGDAAAVGTSDTFTRGDHKHAMPPNPVTFIEFTKDLGANRSGTFDITGLSGLTADKPVLVRQTAAAIASKGNARDEPETDPITVTGYVVDATTIRCYWSAPSVVVGIYAFAYVVGS